MSTHLVKWNELSHWQRDNEHIHTGYLRESHSLFSVIGSLFFCHNETGNIYTHLIPAVFVLFFNMSPYRLFSIGCVLCLGLSATFHTLKSHSLNVAILGNKLDYLGICILIAFSIISLLGFAYGESEKEHYLFVSITIGLGLSCSIMTLMERFRSRHFRPFRALMFVLYGLSGALPIVYDWIYSGYTQTKKRFCLNWLYAEAFFYIFGAFIYAIRFPERCKPGGFDYWGHSHQLFHIFVVVAAWCHYMALRGAEVSFNDRNLLKY